MLKNPDSVCLCTAYGCGDKTYSDEHGIVRKGNVIGINEFRRHKRAEGDDFARLEAERLLMTENETVAIESRRDERESYAEEEAPKDDLSVSDYDSDDSSRSAMTGNPLRTDLVSCVHLT